MADQYIVFPMEVDPRVIADEARAALAAAIPGWVSSPGQIEDFLIEVFATREAQTRQVATLVTRAIFRAWGPLLGVPPIEASRASADTTWTAQDAAGYTIGAGTLVAARLAGDALVGFRVDAPVVIPPGQTATAAGAVRLTAVEPGARGSGLSGAMDLIDALAWVAGVAIVGTTGGGVDAEADTAYLARLSRELELMAPRPILPDDYAVMAARVAGVGRATAIDGLNPVDGTLANQRMVTVAVTDAAGAAVPAAVRGAVEALLKSRREVSFIVHVVDPTYQPVAVTFTAVAHRGYDPAEVRTRAIAAVGEFLSPARWGEPPTGDVASSGGWWHQPTVRRLELAGVLDRVAGLDYLTVLTLNGGTADVALAGQITLPQPGTITATVTAP